MSEWVYFCEECGWLGPISEAEVVPYNGGEEEDVLCRTCKEGVYCIGDKWPPEPWSLEGRLLAERRAREKAETEAKAWRQVAEARNKLLIAYRINSHTRADSALNQIEKAEARLRKLGVMK